MVVHGPLPGDHVAPAASDPPSTDAELLQAVYDLIQMYMGISSEQTVAVVLWIATTHVIHSVPALHTGYLHVYATDPGSGKSTLASICSELVRYPLKVDYATSSALRRMVDQKIRTGLTLVLDELDTYFNSDDGALRGLLNSGYRKGETSLLSNPEGEGRWSPVTMQTFCPKLLSGLNRLPATVESRSIPVYLRMLTREERLAKPRLNARAIEELDDLKTKLRDWGVRAAADLRDARTPEFPEGLSSRQMDSWEAMLMVADYVGGDWPGRARDAALQLHAAHPAQVSLGIELLRNIRTVFGEDDKLSSDDLIRRLVQDETMSWATHFPMTRGSVLEEGEPTLPAKQKLAALLRDYGISPKDVRVGSGVKKGYTKSQFADAWLRYL